MERGKTLTIKRGRETRRFVVDNALGIKVGSDVRLRGEVGQPPWTVTKIEASEIIVRFLLPPKAAAHQPARTGQSDAAKPKE
jgi:hypothetical protein